MSRPGHGGGSRGSPELRRARNGAGEGPGRRDPSPRSAFVAAAEALPVLAPRTKEPPVGPGPAVTPQPRSRPGAPSPNEGTKERTGAAIRPCPGPSRPARGVLPGSSRPLHPPVHPARSQFVPLCPSRFPPAQFVLPGSSILCRFLCPVHPLPVCAFPIYFSLGDPCPTLPCPVLPFPLHSHPDHPSRSIYPCPTSPAPFAPPDPSLPDPSLPRVSCLAHPFSVHFSRLHPFPMPLPGCPPVSPGVAPCTGPIDSPFPSQFPTNSSRTRRGSTRSGSSGGSGRRSPARS